MASNPDKRLVRVRGGAKGFRMISLGDWKREQKEKKGKLPKASSRRQQRVEQKRKDKRKKSK